MANKTGKNTLPAECYHIPASYTGHLPNYQSVEELTPQTICYHSELMGCQVSFVNYSVPVEIHYGCIVRIGLWNIFITTPELELDSEDDPNNQEFADKLCRDILNFLDLEYYWGLKTPRHLSCLDWQKFYLEKAGVWKP